MAIVTNLQLIRCVKKSGIPKELLEEVVGPLEGTDFDMVRYSKKLSDFEKIEVQRIKQNKIQVIRENQTFEQLEGYGGSPREAFASLFGKTIDQGKAKGVSVEAHAQSIKDTVFGKMYDTMKRYRPTKMGFSYDKTGQDNIVRELFGANSGDAEASHYAKTIREQLEYLRTRWNTAGGNIRAMDNYGLPQEHDATTISAAGVDAWKAHIAPLLDLDRMNVTPQELDGMLTKTFNKIAKISDPEADYMPSKAGRKSYKPKQTQKLADFGAEERVYHFSDPEGWLQYQGKFGSNDPIGTIQSHITKTAERLAMIERLGPDPDATVANLVEKWKDQKGSLSRSATSAGERMYANMRNGAGVGNMAAARLFANIRTVVVTKMSGKIVVSALTDAPIAYKQAVYSGMTRSRGLKMGWRLIHNIFTEKDQQRVARLGLMSDHVLSTHRSAERFEETGHATKWIRRLSEGTFRSSGLNRWTESAKAAFMGEFSYHIGDNVSKSFSELHPRLRRTFDRYGIDEKDWKTLSKSTTKDAGGYNIDPSKIPNEDLQVKYGSMMRQETQAAVLEPSVREQSFFREQEAGSVGGELLRNIAVFKSFPMTFINTHLRSLASKNLTNGERLAQVSFMLTALPMLGWVAAQAKKVLRGEIPPDPLEDEEAMYNAYLEGAMQGIGIGILGDMLFSDTNRFGGSLASSFAGPIAGEGESLWKLAQAGGIEMFTDQDKNFKQQAIRKGAEYTPMSSLWYTALPLRRGIVDPLQKAADPQYLRKEARRQRRKEKEGVNSGQWWPAK